MGARSCTPPPRWKRMRTPCSLRRQARALMAVGTDWVGDQQATYFERITAVWQGDYSASIRRKEIAFALVPVATYNQ
eukprot:scaffold666462_cov41-Prasinocladus_malaysianus.AAC.1